MPAAVAVVTELGIQLWFARPALALGHDRFRAETAGSRSLWSKEVVDVRRYLLVLDMDLLAMDCGCGRPAAAGHGGAESPWPCPQC
jgi:hypothetical protein